MLVTVLMMGSWARFNSSWSRRITLGSARKVSDGGGWKLIDTAGVHPQGEICHPAERRGEFFGIAAICKPFRDAAVFDAEVDIAFERAEFVAQRLFAARVENRMQECRSRDAGQVSG